MFDLALSLGRPVGELLDSLSAVELTHWVAYFALNPFGPRQEDARAGVIGSSVLNAIGGAKVQPSDLFPSLRVKSTKGKGGFDAFRAWAMNRAPAAHTFKPK